MRSHVHSRLCSLMAQRLPLILAAAGTTGGLGGFVFRVLSELLEFRVEPVPLPSPLSCPLPDFGEPPSSFELPSSVDLPSVLLGLGLGLLHPLWEELATSQPFLPFGSITKVVQRRHINVGEMRAAIKAEEKLARVHQDVRYVHLQDSQVSLAALNRELQRSLGVYLSSGLRPGYGYLQSKLNPSDDPSSTVTWARWTPSWTLLTLVLLLCGAFPTRPKSHNPLELLDFRLPAPNWAPHSRLRAPPVSFPCPRPRLQ